MKRTYIKELSKMFKEEEVVKVKVQGFVDTIRNKKSMAFLVLRDVTEKVQLTVIKADNEAVAEQVDRLSVDSVITVIGTLVKNEHVKLHGIEILPDEINIESIAEPLPINRDENKGNDKSMEKSSIDQRIDYRHVDLRSDRNLLMFKVQTAMVNSMRNYLISNNFLEIHSPKLIGTASESGSEVFEVKYFDKTAYLAQSPQFYKQMAMASGLERIFEVGPVFRAEKSYTSKHTTEFTGFDLEFSYIDSFYDVMKLEEELITTMLTEIANNYGEDIERLFGIKVEVPTTPFPIITLEELYRKLEESYGYVVPEEEKGDLTTEAEKLSYQWVKETYNHEFLFITDYSAEKRAFYHMRKDGVPQGYDLIYRGVEITTGAQREHRFDILKEQAEEKGLAEDVRFYLEFFKYGCPPHGGFGIGVDRITMLLLGIGIKEAMYIFRGPTRLHP